MKIYVCFQILKSFDDVADSEWCEASKDAGALQFVKDALNPYDESALENALYIKDNCPDSTITAITVCNGQDNSYMYKNMFAVGIDNIVCCHTDSDISFASSSVANILSQQCKDADVILMGCKSSLSMNSLTPYYVASNLGFNIVPNVIDIDFNQGTPTVVTQVDEGSEKFAFCTNTVYTMGNALRSYMRVATLRDKLLVKHKQAETVTVSMPDQEHVPLGYTMHNRQCKMIVDMDEHDIAKLIIQHTQEVGV